MGGRSDMLKKAVVLFSGGLDSTTCVAIAQSQQFQVYALSIDFGQKHKIEVEAAKKIAKTLSITEHRIIAIPLNEFGGSSQTDEKMSIPDYTGSTDIPSTYVPARNTIFLSVALGYAEVIGAQDIFIGVNQQDYSGYPDCREEYLRAFETLANLATKKGIEGKYFHIHAPLLHMNKAKIIETGLRLSVDYSQTISCYRVDSKGRACGTCDSCTYRKKGFEEAHVSDPTPYA
jgi:7-cyano-7-deazaguanine synthase